MLYKRKYEHRLLKLLQYVPVIGIIGPRQVGKTTLINQIKSQIEKDSVYLDLELDSDYNKLNDPELFLSQQMDKCVIIDEIQRKPNLFPLLRALVDQRRENGRFIILGSASPALLKQSSESLAGRITYLEISPFDFVELPDGISMYDHWFRGGFPEALFAPSDEISRIWLDSFIKTYTERELPGLGLQLNSIEIRRLWKMLAHIHGQIINYATLAKSLGITKQMVKKCIDFFEQAYLIKRIDPFYSNLKKRLVKSPKIFISDSGILHQLLSIDSINDLYGHPVIGHSWEGYCINQIVEATQNKYEATFFRTHDGSECDLVLSSGLKPIYAIEIKFTSAPQLSRGNTEAFNAIKTENNLIITPESDAYPFNRDVRVMNLRHLVQELIQ